MLGGGTCSTECLYSAQGAPRLLGAPSLPPSPSRSPENGRNKGTAGGILETFFCIPADSNGACAISTLYALRHAPLCNCALRFSPGKRRSLHPLTPASCTQHIQGAAVFTAAGEEPASGPFATARRLPAEFATAAGVLGGKLQPVLSLGCDEGVLEDEIVDVLHESRASPAAAGEGVASDKSAGLRSEEEGSGDGVLQDKSLNSRKLIYSMQDDDDQPQQHQSPLCQHRRRERAVRVTQQVLLGQKLIYRPRALRHLQVSVFSETAHLLTPLRDSNAGGLALFSALVSLFLHNLRAAIAAPLEAAAAAAGTGASGTRSLPLYYPGALGDNQQAIQSFYENRKITVAAESPITALRLHNNQVRQIRCSRAKGGRAREEEWETRLDPRLRNA
ncbi:mRNA capping large subunit [Cyclospora cayetanensis]|uniref:mRNA capping large subunit n=1 Tax=Cyclospora cayetanensis TaxID=88456 RepID=A0A1D3CVE0_9EIME|nr:mRNA capping large subunit [Cyclospora cayetanensis]